MVKLLIAVLLVLRLKIKKKVAELFDPTFLVKTILTFFSNSNFHEKRHIHSISEHFVQNF